MGDAFDEGYPADGEVPVHPVTLGPFRMDRAPITNDRFARFVEATGYLTEAERLGNAAVFAPLIEAGDDDLLGTSSVAPWWRLVRGPTGATPEVPAPTSTDSVTTPWSR